MVHQSIINAVLISGALLQFGFSEPAPATDAPGAAAASEAAASETAAIPDSMMDAAPAAPAQKMLPETVTLPEKSVKTQPAPSPERPQLYQPSAISSLKPSELKRGDGLFLDDAINANVPGVYMARRTVSAGQQFNIRGYGNGIGARGATNNFDSQGSKVYLNNIPITDAEGITLMDDIDFGSVGSVDITKGPAGSLYGLAIAGAVNLRTVRPERGRTSVGQEAILGNLGLSRYTTHLEVGGERSSLLVNYGKQNSDGFMKHNASEKDFVNVIGEYQPNAQQTINAYAGYSDSYDQRGGEMTVDQWNKGDYSGNPSYIKNNAHSHITGFRGGIDNRYVFNEHFANNTTIFGSGISNDVSSAGGWTDKRPVNYGLRTALETRFRLNDRFSLSGLTGGEGQIQYAQVIAYNMVTDSFNLAGYNIIGSQRSNQSYVSKTANAFTEWTLSMPWDVSLLAGLGFSGFSIGLDNRVFDPANNTQANAASHKPTNYQTSYDFLASPRVGLNKVWAKQISTYATYSKAYKAPVASNIIIATTGQLNSGLEPEIGEQYEVGAKGSLWEDRVSLQAAAFYSQYQDKMTQVAVPLNNTTTLYTYTANGGDQENTGLELSARVTAYKSDEGFLKSVTPFATYTYSDFQYQNYKFESVAGGQKVTADYSGKPVAGVSPHVVGAGLDLDTRLGLYGNVNGYYKDAMPITSDGAYMTESFSLINAKLGVRRSVVNRINVDAFAGANNLMDEKYYIMVFVNQLPDAYIPAPRGVTYFGGLNVKYTF